MADAKIQTLVRKWRSKAGLSQAALAERVGITRQALNAIENGKQIPSTLLSLRLAETLSCRVEDLFALAEPGVFSAMVGRPLADTPTQERVVVAQVKGNWVAHALPSMDPHAALATARPHDTLTGMVWVNPLTPRHLFEENLLVAGCAPLLGPLAQRVRVHHPEKWVSWIHANSHGALDLLEKGLVHLAGIHLTNEKGGPDNMEEVRSRFGTGATRMVNLVRWRQGLLVPPGNPRGIGGVEDLLQPDLKMAWRAPGAGATRLVQRALVQAGAREGDFPQGPRVDSHLDVARAIAFGAAHVGVAIEHVALALGLDFIPLSEERFDLVFYKDDPDQHKWHPLFETMASSAFRKEASGLGGYDLALTGNAVTVAEPGREPR
jgi:molybdate-binding protein/DNA-binding XRE family transcriptional regulator